MRALEYRAGACDQDVGGDIGCRAGACDQDATVARSRRSQRGPVMVSLICLFVYFYFLSLTAYTYTK